MHNINIDQITPIQFPEQPSAITGINCGAFACLLLHKTDRTYTLQQIIYDTKKTINYDIELLENDECLIRKLYYLPSSKLIFVATTQRAVIIDSEIHKSSFIDFPIADNDKLIAVEWNSDGDSLAIAYESGSVKVYYMDCVNMVFNLLAETHPDLKGEENVYLGWGDVKKQFKGKAGVFDLKDNQPPESTYRHQVQNGSISWKHQEHYFCVNSYSDQEHIIRVFDNECRLHYTITNAKIPGICSTTVFGPKHNTLATVCQGNEENMYVVLHERNGGYYNKIIPFKANAKDVQFASCGRVLAVHSTNDQEYFIDIYMRSNFMWHLKQRFTGHVDNLLHFKFKSLESEVFALELVLKNSVVTYELKKMISICVNERVSKAYVQTGSTVYEYDYNKAIIPPCGIQKPLIQMDEPINFIITNNEIDTICLIDAHEVVHVCDISSGKGTVRKQFKLTTSNNSSWPLQFFKYFLVSEACKVKTLIANAINNSQAVFMIDLENGEIREELTQEQKNGLLDMNPLSGQSNKRLKSTCIFKEKPLKCELTTSGDLYLNNKKFASAVTSMMKYNDLYVLITVALSDDPMDKLLCYTTHHLWKLSEYIEDENIMTVYGNESAWCRRVEKGACLVAPANNESVVLELPRGNVEVITVRPIVLANIQHKLKVEENIREAYNIISRNNMEADILFELTNCSEIVMDAFMNTFSPNEVVNILIAMKDSCCLTQTDRNFINFDNFSNKRGTICNLIATAAKNKVLDDSAYYRVVCVALAIQDNYNPGKMLKFLIEMFGGRYHANNLLLLADILNFLKTYIDINEMYRQALTLYDIELAAAIAQVGGIDPQIYRKFLEICMQEDEVSRRFRMANEGANYKSAACYLLILYRHQKKTAQEFLQYVKDKNVVQDVFDGMNRFDGEVFSIAADLVLNKLVEQRKYIEAAYVLLKTDKTERAIELLMNNGEAMKAVQLVMKTEKLTYDEKRAWYCLIAEACILKENYEIAANIYVKHCNDIKGALNCYLEGYLYADYISLLENQRDTIDTNIYKNQLLEHASNYFKDVILKFERLDGNFQTHFDRLLYVRNNSQRRSEYQMDGDDAYSEAGSVTTKSHTSASTTTRRIRKLQLKIRSLRHGGKFEDIALMRELYDIITECYKLSYSLTNLDSLVKKYKWTCSLFDEGFLIRVEHSVQKMEQHADTIWPSEIAFASDESLQTDFCTENIVLLEKEYRRKPKKCVNLEEQVC